MCRLLGIVSSVETHFRFTLDEAPRCLSKLSREHPHGWGVAVFSSHSGWLVHRHTGCAAEDPRFKDAADSEGEVLLAHVRQRTVGLETIENTHPFLHGRWIFAHNGTIQDLAWLESQITQHRRDLILGQTDSERLFSMLLSRLDDRLLTDRKAGEETDRVLLEAAHDLQNPGFGSTNFLLSDGDTLYAHRCGRSLYLLEKTPEEVVVPVRTSPETGAVIGTDWSPERRAIFIASEKITDEPWVEIEEGTLLRIDRRPSPRWRKLQR